MISLGPIQDELHGRYPSLGIKLEVSAVSDHLLIMSNNEELACIEGCAIEATPRKQLVTLLKQEIEAALGRMLP